MLIEEHFRTIVLSGLGESGGLGRVDDKRLLSPRKFTIW
jgi:hypothetical protein